MSDVKSKPSYRFDFYRIFEGVAGRRITDQEHKFLKAMMENYLRDHEGNIPSPEGREHTYLCKKCGGTTIGKGKRFKNKMRAIREPMSAVSV